jgi:hypothetical protein
MRTLAVPRNPLGTLERAVVADLAPPEANFSFAIAAVNGAGAGLASDWVFATGPPIPLAPTDLRPCLAEATPSKLVVTWTSGESPCAAVDGEALEMDDWWFDLPLREVYSGQSARYCNTDLLPAVTYRYRAATFTAAGRTWSEVASSTQGERPQCGNANDVAVQKEYFDEMQGIIQGCLIRCALNPDQAQCALECIQGSMPLSSACAACWVDMGFCTLERCATDCLIPSSERCFTCVERECFPATVQCTGLPMWTFPPP